MRKTAYIHIPFCRRRCFYCDFPISVVGDRARGETSKSMHDYVEQLCTEIIATPKDPAALDTIFFGGGTPSLLSVKQVETILSCLDQTFGINDTAEISMEMDPGTFTLEQLQGLLELGLNRISLGVQAFQDHLLERCGRSHRLTDIHASIQILRQLDVQNFSIDLISGLPDQTEADWHDSLQKAIAIAPQHISCYDMVLEPLTVFGKQEQRGQLDLPEESLSAHMYRQASQQLRDAGYDHYEISNYAKPGFQCRHNVTYWKNDDFYGFGMGAASFHQNRRVTRPRTRTEYYQWLKRLKADPESLLAETEPLNQSDRQFEDIMVGLRLSQGIRLSPLVLTIEQTNHLLQCIVPFLENSWVNLTEDSNLDRSLQLTDPEGFLYSNQVLVRIWESLDHS